MGIRSGLREETRTYIDLTLSYHFPTDPGSYFRSTLNAGPNAGKATEGKPRKAPDTGVCCRVYRFLMRI